MDLEPEPEAAEAPAAEAEEDGSARFASVLGRASRKVAGLRALSLGLVLAAALAGPAPIGAQEGSNAPPAVVGAPEVTPDPGALPQLQFNLGGADGEGLQLSGPVGTVLFIGFMTLIPTLLLLMTGFTRILIVLHLLKQALGTQTAPPAHLLSAMALLLTGFVMAPTFEQVNRSAIQPWMNGEMDQVQALKAASGPMRDFMLGATREQDLAAFVAMRDAPAPETIDDVPMVVLTSAFVTSELTSAFQMGFALFLPFLVIDVVVASVLMSMGMFMLPPVMVSLPFKLLLFVLVDGWSLVMSSLVQSF
jgi:flagellar biosynthesis protein FliP